MPRHKATLEPPTEAEGRQVAGVLLEPRAVFLADQVRAMFRLKGSSLRREIREGRLRPCKRCGRYFFTGQQLLDWLQGGELPVRDQAAH